MYQNSGAAPHYRLQQVEVIIFDWLLHAWRCNLIANHKPRMSVTNELRINGWTTFENHSLSFLLPYPTAFHNALPSSRIGPSRLFNSCWFTTIHRRAWGKDSSISNLCNYRNLPLRISFVVPIVIFLMLWMTMIIPPGTVDYRIRGYRILLSRAELKVKLDEILARQSPSIQVR